MSVAVLMASLTMVPVAAAGQYDRVAEEGNTNPSTYNVVDLRQSHPVAGAVGTLCVDVAAEKAKVEEKERIATAAAQKEKEQKDYISSLKKRIKDLKKENAAIQAENESLRQLAIFDSAEVPFYDVTIPEYKGTKTYERYTKISKNSKQGKLQKMAVTDKDGFRLVCGRYTIAIGSATRAYVGQYVDVILENGTVIPCIMGDQKADCDTEENNLITKHSQCASEFIVDEKVLKPVIGDRGDVSSIYPKWQSPVKTIRVYNMFVPGV